MSDNNKLIAWLIGIFGSAFLLVVGVWAHDRHVEQCIVDHLFDFHLDADHITQDIERDSFRRDVQERVAKENKERQQRWADEIREWWRDGLAESSDDRGTYGRDDRDCNRDR